jgi:hypothetical protein
MIREAFQEAYEAQKNTPSSSPWIRLEVLIPEVSFLSWLDVQSFSQRFYWKSRDADVELASVGQAFSVSGMPGDDWEGTLEGVMASWKDAHSRLRLCGGVAFDPSLESAGPWAEFGSFQFFLPRVELLREGAQQWMACVLSQAEFQEMDVFETFWDGLGLVWTQDVFTDALQSS